MFINENVQKNSSKGTKGGKGFNNGYSYNKQINISTKEKGKRIENIKYGEL